ncbi:ROK family protein [Neptuniibacter halophilus]|uniref:ROK family protein n=1 Tax=Neptuniibacter halophilus TaxID=651666 RepID=UPI002573C6EF|nr:ROK family protein [Neptuniibacter halophilus]
MNYTIGVDLGGTKIEVIALTRQSDILYRYRQATPQGDYLATLQCITHLINQTESQIGQPAARIGVGIPGAVSPATGLIKNANSTCLIGEHLQRDLEQRLDRPIKLANDADCFTLSEATDGRGAGHACVFGVILGTGVGGGIVINGTPLCGPNAITGEWGHNPLPWPKTEDHIGRACYCGQQDCIETFLSGPGFSQSFRRIYGTTASAEEIWRLAETGHEDARDHCDRYLEQLAKSLASVINLLDPNIIVLGGGLSNQARLYQELPGRLQQYVFSDQVCTPIRQAMHGDSSGVRGAAWL